MQGMGWVAAMGAGALAAVLAGAPAAWAGERVVRSLSDLEGPGKGGHRPATAAEVAKAREALRRADPGSRRTRLVSVTVSPKGWICGSAEVPGDGMAGPGFLALDTGTGALSLAYQGMRSSDAVLRAFTANCPGEIAF